MNLFWLRYVSYALLAGAVFFYLISRLNWFSVSRAVKISAYAACLMLACAAWHWREANAERNSPRRLVMGSVASVEENRHRGGSIDDEFQLRLGGGVLSPRFATDSLAQDSQHQPIHQGDVLGVLYRTWDNVPLAIDELEGQRAGWHYSRQSGGNAFIFGVAFAGCLGLCSIALTPRPRKPLEPETALHLNDA